MLENCYIVVCNKQEDLKREGINSLVLANNVLRFKNPPLLEEGQTEETRGEEQKGENHKYWFERSRKEKTTSTGLSFAHHLATTCLPVTHWRKERSGCFI